MAPSDPSPPDSVPPPDNVVALPLSPTSPPRRIRFLDLVVFGLVLGGGIFVASIAAMALLGLDRMQAAMAGGGIGDAGALMVATALCFGVALPAIGIALARHGRAAPELLGFVPVHPGWLWRAALMVLALSVFLDQVVLRILTAIFGDGLKMSVGDMVAAMTTDTPQALLAVLLIGGLAPLVEELVFRGLVWGWLAGRWDMRIVIPISSALFALAHVEPLHVVLVFPIGLLLGWLRWRTGSIWPPIAAHMANNAFAVIATWALG